MGKICLIFIWKGARSAPSVDILALIFDIGSAGEHGSGKRSMWSGSKKTPTPDLSYSPGSRNSLHTEHGGNCISEKGDKDNPLLAGANWEAG